MGTPAKPPPECAQCGTAIPPRAKACPECGADERTGWRETDPYDGLDLPESAFRDDDAEATPAKRPAPRVNGLAWYWWLAAALLLALLVLGAAGGLRAAGPGACIRPLSEGSPALKAEG